MARARAAWLAAALLLGTAGAGLAACGGERDCAAQPQRNIKMAANAIAKQYFISGFAHQQKDENAAAIADYSAAIRLDPKDARAFVNRGWVYDSQGERENPLSGTVATLAALGEQTALGVRLDGPDGHILNFRLATHAARRNALALGAGVTLSALADGIHLMRPDAR